jgi:hypothetical protein
VDSDSINELRVYLNFKREAIAKYQEDERYEKKKQRSFRFERNVIFQKES